jgi:hypothetical protein
MTDQSPLPIPPGLKCHEGQVEYFSLGDINNKWCDWPPQPQPLTTARTEQAPSILDPASPSWLMKEGMALSADATLNVVLLIVGAIVVLLALWRAKNRMPKPPPNADALDLNEESEVEYMRQVLRSIALDMVDDGEDLTGDRRDMSGRLLVNTNWRIPGAHLDSLCILAGMNGGIEEAKEIIEARLERSFEARAEGAKS